MVPDKLRSFLELCAGCGIVGLAVWLMDITGVGAHALEEAWHFNYANPVYIFIVLLFIVAVAVGFVGLLWITQLGEREVKRSSLLETELPNTESKSMQTEDQ